MGNGWKIKFFHQYLTCYISTTSSINDEYTNFMVDEASCVKNVFPFEFQPYPYGHSQPFASPPTSLLFLGEWLYLLFLEEDRLEVGQ